MWQQVLPVCSVYGPNVRQLESGWRLLVRSLEEEIDTGLDVRYSISYRCPEEFLDIVGKYGLVKNQGLGRLVAH